MPGEVLLRDLGKVTSLLIRAGDETTSATDADLRINGDYAVLPFRGCAAGAYVDARRMFTVVAEDGIDELVH